MLWLPNGYVFLVKFSVIVHVQVKIYFQRWSTTTVNIKPLKYSISRCADSRFSTGWTFQFC